MNLVTTWLNIVKFFLKNNFSQINVILIFKKKIRLTFPSQDPVLDASLSSSQVLKALMVYNLQDGIELEMVVDGI